MGMIYIIIKKTDQTRAARLCCKGVGLGPFPSDSLEPQSCDFDEIAHIKPLCGVESLHKCSNCKEFLRKSKNSHFLVIFANFNHVSQITVIRF